MICLWLLPVSLLQAQVAEDTTIIEEVQQEQVIDEETDKEEQQEYFIEKDYQDDTWKQYNRRKVPDSVVRQMQKDDDFWYANTIFEKKKPKPESSYLPIGQRTWFKTLIWLIIVGGFVTVLILFLASSDVGLFRKRPQSLSKQEDEDEMPEDIFAINYQKEIDKATAKGDYRLAVRLMFLRLLKIMAEKNVIQYKQDKTNLDYLSQLFTTSYHKDFFRITRHYEFSWYGK
ncbi:MAG TPA: hypothetical protein VFV31_04860, partial [Chitinophagaceae bacterium]|nr:hypothetical protein [Chitinophagaceae bacterium]